MVVNTLKDLIAAGLPQPKEEPTFFYYPSGYDLTAPMTGYNTVDLSGTVNQKDEHAKLEPGSRRT